MPGPLPVPQAFRVSIAYREPTYELRAGKRAEPFCSTYEIMAASEAEAAATAVHEFNLTTCLSGVGWVRKIVGIQVAPAVLH
ncbi:MAG: hypothetical protein HYZ27_09235 [Deltaproteobacteria bacterium]|nr:hypothetical protein [Deltaproteobacteria bacterium]